MEKLNILWTSDNKDTIFPMISMYAINSKKKNWWDEVNLIMWGASVKLASIDTQVQTEIRIMLDEGVHIEACKDCADRFEASETLEKSGVNARYMGDPLTRYIKAGEKVLTI